MRTNTGPIERTLRIAAGLGLVGLAVTDVLGPWAYLGMVPLLTGALGLCPLYGLLGINRVAARR